MTRFWALVPARGGSKSIPLKNLALLAGRPLLDYVVLAARAWGRFERIVCSTDDPRIAAQASQLGIENDARPAALAGDDTPVAEVARDFLRRASTARAAPDWLVLLQPTSPFVLPEHLERLAGAMEQGRHASSAQTIAPVPHNHHAWNQRLFVGGQVRFALPEQRAQGYNKQRKPRHFVFGNLVAARPATLLGGGDFFSPPSLGVEIARPYDLDVDDASDLALAEAILARGFARLDHLPK